MKKRNKIILYSILLVLGLLILNLQAFVFEAPDVFLGFIVCIISVYLILGSIIKLCKLSKTFSNTLLASLDILFWIP